jgi:drug/metabolite transporter (DMT)-like permease
VPLEALGLALAAAVVHALWNLVVARAPDPEAAGAVAFCIALVAWAPVAIVRWDVDAAAWPYVAGSAAFELVYLVLLVSAYARSEISLVYPIARGVAPVLVLLVAAAILGRETSWRQAVAVCAIGGGVLLVRGLRRSGDTLGAALAVGVAVSIAGYTLLDKEGVAHADPIAYLEVTMVAPTLLLAALVWARKGVETLRAAVTPATLVAAPATFGSYALALAALQLAPAAAVAAVRETSVLIVTALAALMLKETVGAERAVGAVLIVVGVVLLGL